MSGVTKLVPAKLRSSPRMRSSSSGCPIDSWICRIIWSGASSTSIVPLGQFGASTSSSASSATWRPLPTKPARSRISPAPCWQTARSPDSVRRCVSPSACAVADAAGIEEAVALHDVAAGARHQAMRRRAHVDVRVPVDDARIDRGRARLGGEHRVDVAARGARRVERGRAVLAARTGARQRARVDQAHARGRARPGERRVEGGLAIRRARCRRSRRSPCHRRHARWPSRHDRSRPRAAAARSCAPRSFRRTLRRNAATRSRRRRRGRAGGFRRAWIRRETFRGRRLSLGAQGAGRPPIGRAGVA